MPSAVIITLAVIASVSATAVTMYGQYQQGKAEKEMADYEAQIANNNAKVADDNANIQLLANEQALKDQRRRNEFLQERTRAKYAKAGVAMDSQSAIEVMVDEAGVMEVDALNQASNDDRKVYELKQRAKDSRTKGELLKYKGESAKYTSRLSMLGTGIGGVGNALTAGTSGADLGAKLNS